MTTTYDTTIPYATAAREDNLMLSAAATVRTTSVGLLNSVIFALFNAVLQLSVVKRPQHLTPSLACMTSPEQSMVLSGREAQLAPVRELVSRLAPLTDTSETQAARWFRRAVEELVSNISSDLQSPTPPYDLNTAIILVTEELGRLTEVWMNKTESFAEWCALQRALNGELGCVPRRFVLPATEDESEQLVMRSAGAYALRRWRGEDSEDGDT